MRILAALLFAAVFPVAAQTPQVPSKMEFAGITLTIRDDARREIQKDVDALTLSPKHYNIKADRAKMYFPLIEQAFAEEQLPEDFKYLAIQESALIADAVSSSNAVGFWQFKDFTAIEMGLRVDKEIDERLNIVSASRAAARYIKKNNTFFDNWIYALQAYQMGAGGVMRSVNDTKNGAKHMEITSKTYWYVKKFLAHKIAYEPGVKGTAATPLVAYENTNGKSLRQLAKEVSVEESTLLDYNKWTKSGWVPTDKTYVVMIPVPSSGSDALLAIAKSSKLNTPVAATPTSSTSIKPYVPAAKSVKKRINGVLAIQAVAGETPAQLASRADVEENRLLKWNDLESGSSLIEGEYYFLSAKRGRASENFHKLQSGENLWLVSQHYGVKLRKLKKYNRVESESGIAAGTMLYLASVRPSSEAVVTPVENPVVVDNSETFNWETESTSEKTSILAVKDTITMSFKTEPEKSEPVIESPVIDSSEPDTVTTTMSNLEVVSNNPTPIVLATEESQNDKDSVITEAPIVVKPPQVIQTVKGQHTVAPKETFYSIAKLYNVAVMDLVEWNNLELKNGLKIGQVLKVAPNKPVAANIPTQKTGEVMHEVKSSDTLYSIARQYGVTIKDLMDWNEKKDFSLAVGEKLKISQRN